ncbi:hypothetical protein GJ697_23555 [Pseudoduganella sp. FT25W]|uniref:Uncharacterized protein n=1 Tax=Duganella alba TaxID=2666081 RepID=A0A6L5QM16_9BURK|nr:hypothetical protein [Duganella alba]MRX10810.1 hypothetical protein [Duganella alba]MRX18929.1 hypothetical protein [Duganella alba]
MRHTRDAWRSGVIDPADGLPDSARKTLGKRKTMPALYTAAAVLDDEGDNWIAVFYSAAHEAQFTELCEQLDIRRIERAAWR